MGGKTGLPKRWPFVEGTSPSYKEKTIPPYLVGMKEGPGALGNKFVGSKGSGEDEDKRILAR